MKKMPEPKVQPAPDLASLLKPVQNINKYAAQTLPRTLFEEMEKQLEEEIVKDVKPLTKEQLQKLYGLFIRHRIPGFYRMVITNLFNMFGLKFADTQRNMAARLKVSTYTINKMLKYMRQMGIQIKTADGAAGYTFIDATEQINANS